MPSTDDEENDFKVTWTVEGYSLFAESSTPKEHWMTTHPFLADAVTWADWIVGVCPRTAQQFIACSVQSTPGGELDERVVTFKYSVSVVGVDGWEIEQVEGVHKNLGRRFEARIEVLPTDELPPEDLAHDKLNIVCKLRRVKTSRTDPERILETFRWDDEQRALSVDMGVLLETGHLSDLELVTNDGTRLRVHLFLVHARWPKMSEHLKTMPGTPSLVTVDATDGHLLTRFVSYLYTGTISATDLTTDLFEYVVASQHSKVKRDAFYTNPRELSVRTRQSTETVAYIVTVDATDGHLLTRFVSYLYTGTIPATDLTTDLFEYVVASQHSSGVRRDAFYTNPRELSVVTRQSTETVAFTWRHTIVGDTGVDFVRVLPVREGDLIVEMSSADGEDSDLVVVKFSLSKAASDWVHLRCTSTLFMEDGRRQSATAGHYFEGTAFEPWRLPDFIRLGQVTESIRVHFEVTVTTTTGPCIFSNLTEFRTGARDVRCLDALSSDLYNLFAGGSFENLCDIVMKSDGGFYLSSRALLGARSGTLRGMFGDYKGRVSLDVPYAGVSTLASVLEYVYTGWTRLTLLTEVVDIHTLAERMSLGGLVRKCEQFMSLYRGRRM